jgi:hypothetical protein
MMAQPRRVATRVPRSEAEGETMTYCSKCGQLLPKPKFRIVNGPARVLFALPAFSILSLAVQFGLKLPPPQPTGATLAIATVLTAALYAWIGLSGR